MTILGTLLKNKRAGEAHLAWNLPALAGPEVLGLNSSDFEHEGVIPKAHAGKRAGGENRSPALAWSGTPEGTAQLLLVVQDIDSPTRIPSSSCSPCPPPSPRRKATRRSTPPSPGRCSSPQSAQPWPAAASTASTRAEWVSPHHGRIISVVTAGSGRPSVPGPSAFS
ncbi:hypothetical protein ACGFNP_28195 [Nonomuraea sp. NPDC049269]|uniref:hypothetical protein n=1 Tax=Nonomuraea sp. NPDC049269 TaxID=3364349 RepID=UPI003713D477